MNQEQRQIVERVQNVIDTCAVGVVFQPIVDTNDGMIVAYEALVRPKPESGFANPTELFHAAEGCGLIWPLECVTRRAAIQAAADWPADVMLFLNNSPRVFADSRFAATVKAEVQAQNGLLPERVVLEITETAEGDDDDLLVAQVVAAKAAGFAIAVDDAGAGTSGLNRMMVLRPNWIKLDRQFCAGIDTDTYKQNLVRFFVQFARTNGVNVVGEGVETEGELAAAMSLGVRFAQGYYLGRPGERVTTLDPEFAERVRERWATVQAVVPETPQDMPLAKLCRPLMVLTDADMTVGMAARRLKRSSDMVGLIVKDGKKLIGWASQAALNAAVSVDPDAPLGRACGAVPFTLTPEATIQDVLRAVSAREDQRLSEPVLIERGGEIVGVLRVQDVLKAAASDARTASSLRAPVTGLPARVRADQHMEDMIGRAADPVVRASPIFHSDAAFIDLRGIAEYNSVRGYEAGDRLIRELAQRLQARVVAPGEEVFLSHIGNDRFLLTAPAGLLRPRLHAFLAGWSSGSMNGGAGGAGGTGAAGSVPQVGLRVLLLSGVFDHATHPRDVYKMEQTLRTRAKLQERTLPLSEPVLIVGSDAEPYVLRRSA